MSTLAARTQPIAIELHGLLRDLDRSRFRADIEAAARRRIAEVAQAIQRMLQVPEADDPVLTSALTDVAQVLDEKVPREQGASEAWTSFRKQLGAAYESLSQRLRARSIATPSLRPTNYTRSVVHALTGISCIVLVQYILDDRWRAIVPCTFALTFWLLETLRRVSERANRALMWVFRHIAHPREAHHVNSSTWYGTALALLGLLFPRSMCTLAIAVIAFADPAASLVGRRFGRIKLVGERSLEGTVAFTAVAMLAGFASLMLWHAGMTSGRALTIAACAGVASAVAELLSRRVDDNFSVPLVAGSVGWLVLALS